MNSELDILIIGGGINGMGIAADAAGRGLSVLVCEKNDIASATSSASSKLIHGGLRYLEHYDFRLVRRALLERENLLRLAPHLISPLEFILPYEKNLRPGWLIRIGLFLYDHLTFNSSLPSSKKINLKNDARGDALNSTFETGFSYFDCRTDDARLVILNALSAKENGATILTRTEFISARYENKKWMVILKDNKTQEMQTYYSKVLVNATGPWVMDTQKKVISQTKLLVNLVKGSHIVIPKLYEGDFAYILQNKDKRVVFIIPYENNFTLIGTTDVASSENFDMKISLDEEKYLLDTINFYLKKLITRTDIVWSFSGIRSLQSDTENKLSAITRDYKFELIDNMALLTVISGKLTTYRCLAQDAVDQLHKFFPNLNPSETLHTQLPGGDIKNRNFRAFLKNFCEEYAWLPTDIATRYAKNYGTRAKLLLQNKNSMNDLGENFSHGLYENEVRYLMQEEWAQTSEDILWRRTKLGLYFTKNDTNKLDDWIAKQT
ncbi:MAG: glycerol-3-phosphate dehydrogenase [Gammaproteobacteria bacterium]|nr:glycerol-3-phosphate dehydrogenase [Gammaproteobacteria bacterium]